jgi:enamine deaminase RidA (YjgF/YER057c/UK114 family)
MVKIQRVSSGTIWEDIVGYSRAIRVNSTIEVAGTTAVDENGNLVGPNDPYEQTRFIIQKAQKALQELGADLKDVIRTRIYTTDISRWEKIGKAHGEFFKDIKPVASMVEISSLINTDILVEIEFSAIIQE